MSASNPAPAESALSNVRAEWVESTVDSNGVPRPPSDPAWNRFGDYIDAYPGWSGDAAVEAPDVAGEEDIVDHFRGAEEHDLAVSWWLQRHPVTVNHSNPASAGELGVKSTESGDTDIDVVIENADGSVSETITTDGTDGTTFVAGSTSFSSLGRVEVLSSHSGEIEVYTDSSGSPGTKLGGLASGTTKQNKYAANDPAGELIAYDSEQTPPIHEVVIRREVDEGGADNHGFRHFIYGSGCRPTSASYPGDPAASNPILAEAGYAAEKVRDYIIHQPASSTKLRAESTDDSDGDGTASGLVLTIEDEDANTTETLNLDGTTTVVTSSTFNDIDALWLDGEPAGDIDVWVDDSGSKGAKLTENGITGSNTDGVEGDRGIPPLGSGSHASAIGTDPSSYLFLGTSATFAGGNLAASATGDRVHALDLSIELDETREARQGTRRQSIDLGTRTVTVEADLAGPYESVEQNYRHFRSVTGDVVYTLPDGTIEPQSMQVADVDDTDFEGGDANAILGVTLEAHKSDAADAALVATES